MPYQHNLSGHLLSDHSPSHRDSRSFCLQLQDALQIDSDSNFKRCLHLKTSTSPQPCTTQEQDLHHQTHHEKMFLMLYFIFCHFLFLMHTIEILMIFPSKSPSLTSLFSMTISRRNMSPPPKERSFKDLSHHVLTFPTLLSNLLVIFTWISIFSPQKSTFFTKCTWKQKTVKFIKNLWSVFSVKNDILWRTHFFCVCRFYVSTSVIAPLSHRRHRCKTPSESPSKITNFSTWFLQAYSTPKAHLEPYA